MKRVSTATSMMPHIPCSTGEHPAAEFAITEEPSPASLELTPRATPTDSALARP